MKKRSKLALEQLEARETPDVSLGRSAALAIPLPAGPSALDETKQLLSIQSLVEVQQALALQIPPGNGQASGVAFHSRILESLFRNSEELDQLLARSLKIQPADDAVPSADAGNVDMLEATGSGLKFFSNYARKAIRNEEEKYGRFANHDDLFNEIYVQWREDIGVSDRALGNLLDKNSAERQALRKAVRRVLDHERYDQQRQQKVVEFVDQPAPANPAAQEWHDLQIDWSDGVGDLGPRERQMLELRREGMTFDEIGAETGMAKQRVCEIYNAALERLQEVYCAIGDDLSS